MRLVIVESPYAGDIETNVAYARRAVADCVRRGEAPICSHLLFTQPGILDDAKPDERALGIAAGLAWYSVADAVVFYQDRDMSPGMLKALEHASDLGIRTEFRKLHSSFNAPEPKDLHIVANDEGPKA